MDKNHDMPGFNSQQTPQKNVGKFLQLKGNENTSGCAIIATCQVVTGWQEASRCITPSHY